MSKLSCLSDPSDRSIAEHKLNIQHDATVDLDLCGSLQMNGDFALQSDEQDHHLLANIPTGVALDAQ